MWLTGLKPAEARVESRPRWMSRDTVSSTVPQVRHSRPARRRGLGLPRPRLPDRERPRPPHRQPQRLRGAGCRATRSRRRCRRCGRSETPCSRRRHGRGRTARRRCGWRCAYDIAERLSVPGRRVAAVSVYRALDFLTENGLVHRIARGGIEAALDVARHGLVDGAAGAADQKHRALAAAMVEGECGACQERGGAE
jgi:Fur family zinc uptake transcriptional regulator